jgi:hypothetical protein
MIKESFASAIEHQQWTGQIREATLQGLSEEDVKNWPVQFAEKIVTVKDFSELYHSFMVGALKVVLPFDKNGVVQAIIDLHENYKSATLEDWQQAWVKAWIEAWALPWQVSATNVATSAAEFSVEGWHGRATGEEFAYAVANTVEAVAEAASLGAARAVWATAVAADSDVDALKAWAAAAGSGPDVDVARVAGRVARGAAWQKIRDVFLNAEG